MADHRNHRHAVYCLALIGLGVLVHYGWALAPVEHQAQVWNACGGFARLALVLALAWRVRSFPVLLVALWWACEELLVIGCSVAYIVSPWQIDPGQAQCSALLQFDLGRIGVFVAIFLLALAVKSYRSQTD